MAISTRMVGRWRRLVRPRVTPDRRSRRGTAAASADEVDDFIDAQLRAQRIPGLALAVVKDGRVVKVAGYGVADRTTNTPVAADTVFKIGSISKPILATAVMRLVQDGRIELDAPVRTYLQDAPPAWNGITVRHLLSHSAGLVRDADDSIR